MIQKVVNSRANYSRGVYMFSDNLKRIRKNFEISQRELAERLFVSQQAVAKWETGKATPTPEMIAKIAEVLGVTASHLIDGHAPVKAAVRIPVLGRVPAGIPIEAIEEILDWEEIPASWEDGDQKYFSTIVKGDSMYPKYQEGDVIIVRKQETCESGQDCVVYVNGYDATLKKVYLLEDGGIRLQPINTQYQPRSYYPGDDPISIAGVVVEIRRKP